VKTKLQSALGVAITTDGWSSLATKAYLNITAHWLDEDFRMQRAVLGISRLMGSHTHDKIADCLREVIARFDLTSKVFHATTDNADPWVQAVRDVLELLSTRCFAHSLQLVVKHALEANETVIKRVRDVVSLFHHSPGKQEVLEVMQKQVGMSPGKLIGDVPTRWSSTHDMMQSVLKNRPALNLIMDPTIPLAKQLNDSDYDTMEELVAGLKPYKEITIATQGEMYPTLNMLLPLWFGLVDDAEDYATTRGVHGALAAKLLKEMDRRSDKITSRAALLACVLDPRWRQLRCLGSDADEKQEAIHMLRDEYAKECARVREETSRASAVQGNESKEIKEIKEIKESKESKESKVSKESKERNGRE
jgi:zinc finger BED domain-containing protein 1 (E3 SUMO-protein ligase ZBED1)